KAAPQSRGEGGGGGEVDVPIPPVVGEAGNRLGEMDGAAADCPASLGRDLADTRPAARREDRDPVTWKLGVDRLSEVTEVRRHRVHGTGVESEVHRKILVENPLR